jgi:hypothetical protein
LNGKNLPETPSVKIADPETGVHMWMNAVNAGNVVRLYDLAPDEIKKQRTLVQFEGDNVNSTFLLTGYDFTSYRVIDKKQNGTYAQIIADVDYQQPENQGTPDTKSPLIYTFDLFYEHGEWKVWTDAETGIQMWIAAVNARDLDRVYDLAPDTIKQRINLTPFKESNINNSFLQPGNFYSDYTVIDKEQNATDAQIDAQLFFNQSADMGNASHETPISYRFGLYYEHGEWKIWTLDWL